MFNAYTLPSLPHSRGTAMYYMAGYMAVWRGSLLAHDRWTERQGAYICTDIRASGHRLDLAYVT